MPRPLITVTDAAVTRIKHLLANASTLAHGLRISVKTKGCSGLSYNVEYAETAKPGDEIIDAGGTPLFIDQAATLFLIGTEMDYLESAIKSGFEFRNPNEAGRCGCGESFFVDKAQLASKPSDTH